MSDDINENPALRPGRQRGRGITFGALALLVTGAVVAVVVVTAGGSTQAQSGTLQDTTASQRVDALLAGVPESGNTLGAPAAPVTLQFFGDLQCPTSREFVLGALPSLIDKFVRNGQLRIEYRSLESATRDPALFTRQQVAALAAGMQDKLWYYVEDFYGSQGREGSGYVNESFLRGLAEQAPGMNLKLWTTDRAYPPLAAQVAFDEQTAAYRRLRNTPSFLIGRTGSPRMRPLARFSVLESPPFEAAIERVLAGGVRSRSSQTADAGRPGRADAAYRVGSVPPTRKERSPC
jgi:protein-disulfide isomerase